MDFFKSAIEVLQTLVIALGAGLGVWGVINLLEGYGNDNPGAKSQGMKQLMSPSLAWCWCPCSPASLPPDWAKRGRTRSPGRVRPP